MSGQRLLIVLLVIPMVLSLGLGIWIGLGYPGLHGRFESGGRTPERTPWELVVDWLVERLGG